MKLYFLIEFTSNTGGMLQSVTSIINGLSKSGLHQISLISPFGSDISQIQFDGDVKILSTKQKAWSISRKSLLSTIKVAFNVWKMVRKDIKDSYFVTNDYGSSILLSFIPSFKLKEIYICRGGTFHGDGLGGFFMRNKIRYGHITRIVTTSSHLKKMILGFHYPEDRITVIFNGVTKPTFDFKYNGLNRNCLRISTIGFISDRKNHIEGVRLVKMLREKGINAFLYIYGAVGSKPDAAYKVILDKEIDDLGVTEFVVYKGFVKGDKLFEETDLMISFAKEEGFGRTLPEAMLRKLPFIAYRGAGGPVDITQDGRYGYLVDNCVAVDYLERVEWMFGHPDELKRNVYESYDYAMSIFTEEQMVGRYVNFVTQIKNGNL